MWRPSWSPYFSPLSVFVKGHFSPDDNLGCFPETGHELIFLPNERTLPHPGDHCFSFSHALSFSPKLTHSAIYSPPDSAGMVALGPQRQGSAGRAPVRRSWNNPSWLSQGDSCRLCLSPSKLSLFLPLAHSVLKHLPSGHGSLTFMSKMISEYD